LPNVTHDPYENSLTLRPVPPRRLYSKGTPPHAPRKLGALASSKLREGLEPASRNWKPLRDKSATRPSSPQA
jgi:hypothetical protein